VPIAKVQLPDGRVARLEVPEGTTPQQAESFAFENFNKGQKGAFSQAAAPEQAAIDVANRRPTAGLIDAGLSLGSGAIAGPVSGLAGLAGAVLPGPEGQGADYVRKTQAALTYEPRTKLGKGITDAVSYPFQKLGEAADAAGAATTDKTGSPGAGAGVNMALQSVPLMLGRVAPVGEGAAALERRNSLKAKNAQTDAATIQAKEAGYVIPPTQANPSLLNQIVEGASGKIKTAQKMSEPNQELTNSLVRKGLGISEDAPLTIETLNNVRKEAGTAYERVRGAGRVTPDQAYFAKLDSIAAPFERASKDFPDAARTDIIDAVKAARRDSFDAGSAVDQISILRDKADSAFTSGDKSLGRAYKGISNALEEQLGRHLEKTSPNALEEFQNARETIAKSYTVQKHLQPSGNINTAGLAADLKKGKPLTGEIKTVAEFGSNFPKAAQLPEKIGGVPMSPWEHGASAATVVGAVASGHPMLAIAGLAPYLRPAVRSAIMSKLYQESFTNPQIYGPSAASRLQALLGEAQRQPLVPLTEMSEGQRK
jgi:hypothetical protein